MITILVYDEEEERQKKIDREIEPRRQFDKRTARKRQADGLATSCKVTREKRMKLVFERPAEVTVGREGEEKMTGWMSWCEIKARKKTAKPS